ncbi:MAG: hypothetical protein RIQ81_288 [Pseudomonadota bacterium]
MLLLLLGLLLMRLLSSRRFTVGTLIVPVFLSACGGTGADDKPPYSPVDTSETARNPDGSDVNGFDDAACQGAITGANAVVEAGVFEWSDGKIEERRVPLTSVTSAPVLASRHITRTTYGLRERADCELSGSSINCPSEYKVIDEPKPLRICRERALFPRTSHETVALMGLYTLNTAYEFHNSLPSRRNNLPTTELVVLPRVERAFAVNNASGGRETRISLVTDNLAYAPAYRNGPAFLIYPKSQKAADAGLWKDLFLWEVPWALGHEFGHHILRSYAFGGATNLSLTGDAAVFDSPIPPMFDWSRVGFQASSLSQAFGGLFGGTANAGGGIRIILGNPFQTSGRQVGPNLYWGAVNEAFADLYSRYVRNGANGQLRGVDCFAGSRDVESPLFGDGQRKVYDERVQGIFLSRNEMDGAESCSAPDFQGIHTIGAILAHGINAAFDSTVADIANRANFASDGQKSILKGDMLIRWASRMGNQIRANSPVTLGSFVREAFAVMAESRASTGYPAGQLGAGQCQVMQAVLPALVPEIIGNGSLRCGQ